MSSNKDAIEAPKQPFGETRAWRILWAWLWRNTLSFDISLILGFLLYIGLTEFSFIGDYFLHTVDASRNALLVGGSLGATLAGVVLGYFQQDYLSRYFVVKHWILLTTGGTALGTLCALIIATFTSFGVALQVLSIVIMGACLGVAQWLALRRHFFRSGYWVLGCIIATLVFRGGVGAVLDAVSAFPEQSGLLELVPLIFMLAGILITGVLFSAVTGITFVWLFRFPKRAG